MRILVIDDDKEVRDYLRSTLEAESFAVDIAEDGKKGSYDARTNDYDLILLDNVMPEKTGFEVCREIRQSGKMTPIMMLSVKAEIEDRVRHLDCGADDYLAKPYSHDELLARIRAMLRREARAAAGPEVFACGYVSLNPTTQEVRSGARGIYLTRKEFALLELLLKNKGKVVSRGMIMEHVWDMDGNPLSKTIETHVLNVRKKIERRGRPLIRNVPGRGYKISDQPEGRGEKS